MARTDVARAERRVADQIPSPGPAALEVFRNFLAGSAEETWLALRRSAYSLNIKERGDCSAAIFDARGEMLALPNAGVPLHLGSMEGLVEEILRRYPVDEIVEGDVFITNDPYSGGATHTNDYCCVSPVFDLIGGGVIAYVANVGHHADVGGRVACTQAPDNGSIFEEGILVPPVRLWHGGIINREVYDIICRNSRESEDRRGDIAAHVASLRVGTRRVGSLVASLGASTFSRSADELLDYSERRMRMLLGELQDGSWKGEDFLDGDGLGSSPVGLRLTLTKHGESLTLDWRDVPGQVESGRNIPLKALRATCFTVIRGLLDPGMHLNAGINRVVTFETVPGSFVHAVHPAACSERATPCQVVADITASCIGQMSPDKQIAANGAAQGWAFSGIDPRTDRLFANYETMAGGLGATTFSDGMDAVRGWPTGSMNPPIEALEQDVPVVVRRYELLPDSGGDGKRRGGLGLRRELEIRSHNTKITTYAMRQIVPPPGANGGAPGGAARFTLDPGTAREQVLPSVLSQFPLEYGTIVRCDTSGGGGWGDPRERVPEEVHRDVLEERVSPPRAKEAYGLDLETPAELRRARMEAI